MNISYAEIKKGDYPFLREILYEALFVPEGAEPFNHSIIDLPDISKYIDDWGVSGDFGHLIYNNEDLIGAVWGRLFSESNKGFGFVDKDVPELTIALKSNYRNKGLGTMVMKNFFQTARDYGYSSVSLSVDKRNRAFNFYKKIGFVVVEEVETAYTMEKKI